MIKLSEDDIDIIHVNEFYCHVRFSSLEGYEIQWTDKQAHELKKQILKNIKTVEEFKKRLEQMKTISFPYNQVAIQEFQKILEKE